MRIVKLNGGLGNQAFQYIFMRWIEEKTGEQCVIDDLSFCGEKVMHNGYELEKIFSIKHSRLSDMLDKDVIDEILRLLAAPVAAGEKSPSIIDIFKSCGMDLFLVQEGNNHTYMTSYKGSVFSVPANGYYPDILRCSGDLYYYGYWINGKWFDDIKDTIIKEFTFPPLPDEKNKNYMEEIKNASDRSAAVHVRRGDFLDVGWVQPLEKYREGLGMLRSHISKPIFFVFSDDIDHVKNNSEDYGFLKNDEIVFVEGNMGGNNYIDMQLMSACRAIFMSGNSSFSYLAALLDRRTDRIVINPTERELY